MRVNVQVSELIGSNMNAFCFFWMIGVEEMKVRDDEFMSFAWEKVLCEWIKLGGTSWERDQIWHWRWKQVILDWELYIPVNVSLYMYFMSCVSGSN